MFQLEKRALPGHFLFLDEAQDSNGVTIAIVKHQQSLGTRVVAVGDECQAINGWMGAVDAMGQFGGTRLQLSKSFRFGPAIAEEANKWLTLLDAKLRITGHDPVGSVVRSLRDEVPAAILCRKNATAINEAMTLAARGSKVALVKTVGEQIVRLARAAQQLKEGRQTDHPELMGFESWGMVQEYVEHDHGGSDLKVFVELIDTHTPETLIEVIGKFPAPGDRGVECVVSTAHRSKGLEWDTVRIADDFADGSDKDDHEPSREDLMLAYVAVTRAKKALDLGGLSWVNKLLGQPAGPRVKHDPWETAKAPWKPGDPYIVKKAAVAV
jgi:superfamily I DNA/RNA helicase